jgi:LacI family transcriptional regulator
MKKRASLKSISEDLNISKGTVSRVLNGKAEEYRISKETVNRVLKYARETGYSPNLMARGLQASRSFTIGLVIPDIANPFFALMAKHIENAASKADYSIILFDTNEDLKKEKLQIQKMLDRNVDGIIAAPVGTSFDHFKDLINQEIPLVFIDRYSLSHNVPYISSDNYGGAFDAIRLLLDSGHRKIGLIKGNDAIEPVKERKKGYLDALVKEGIDINPNWMAGNAFSIDLSYQCTLDMLSKNDRPSAFFAMSNLLGLGVIRAVNEKGLKIPDDISLIVFDEQPYSAFLNPPLTTVRQNSEEIGKMAVEYVLKKIDDYNAVLKSVNLPVELIPRKSVLEIK